MSYNATPLPYWHNPEREHRIVHLSVGMPGDVFLGVLCHSNANTERAAAYFIEAASHQPDEVAHYLRMLIEQLGTHLDFGTCELKVKAESVGSTFDFGRPSPARMLVWQFFGIISRNDCLYSHLASHPMAPLVFHSSFARR